jgi:hypothetical protein
LEVFRQQLFDAIERRRRPEDEFRWYEVSYKQHGLYRGPLIGPFAIQEVRDDIYAHADAAAGPGMHVIKIESGPTPIDDEAADDFVERWLSRFVDAYNERVTTFSASTHPC